MIQYYVESFPVIFGEHYVSYNVHSLLHLTECVKKVGFLGSFSAYDFENFLQHLKQQVKSPRNILQQLNNKIVHDNYVDDTEESAVKYDRKGVITSLNLPGFYLSLKSADKFCFVKSGFAVEIKHFSNDENKLFIVGHKILNCTNFYTEPMQSLDIGIFLSEGCTCTTAEHFNCDDILYKLIRLPYQNKFVFLPILHKQN